MGEDTNLKGDKSAYQIHGKQTFSFEFDDIKVTVILFKAISVEWWWYVSDWEDCMFKRVKRTEKYERIKKAIDVFKVSEEETQ